MMNSESKYTADQWEIVKKINKKRDYYDILGVEKDCSEEELKKAYKRLALKLHPDKNQAPGSTEAFKSVSKAFSALSDPQEKKRYDGGVGGDGDSPSPFYGTPFNFDGYHFSAEDLFAEDVFNLFFGQSNPNFRYRQNHARTTRRRSRTFNTSQQQQQQHHQQQQQQQHEHPRRQRQQFRERHQHGSSFLNSYNFLVQMSPLLLMVLLSVMNTFFSHEEVYSLKQTEKHAAGRRTTRFGVSFYLKENFKEKYEGHLASIEQQVEDKHIRQLRNDCYRERSARETALWKARMYNNKALFESTRNERLKSCDELQALISSH